MPITRGRRTESSRNEHIKNIFVKEEVPDGN
jgi:hypothetical protein